MTKKAIATGPLASTPNPTAMPLTQRHRTSPTSDSQKVRSAAVRQSTSNGSVSSIRPAPTTSRLVASTSGATSDVSEARRRRETHATMAIVPSVAAMADMRGPTMGPNAFTNGMAAQ